jgi:hypothetical protein
MDLIGSVIAANPCPPMPVQCMRKHPATDKMVPGFLNTHHVLMQAYAHAMQRDCARENLQRQQTQTELTRVFMTAFAGGGSANPEKLYAAASVFTRCYLHSFMPNRPIPDARFAPYDEVSTSTYDNNPIVRASCEHLAGMIFYDECPAGEEGQQQQQQQQQRSYADIVASLKTLPFSQILCMYAAVHRGRFTAASSVVEMLDE